MLRFLTRAPAAGACALLFALGACASAPALSASRAASPQRIELRELPEPAALSLLDRLLLEQRQLPVAGWKVLLPARTDFEVDLRIGESRFGVEWVSPRDRELYGAALPEPDPGGQLRLLRAAAAGEQPLILLLDDRNYRLALGGRVSEEEGARELEQRLRRDLGDFLQYARGQE